MRRKLSCPYKYYCENNSKCYNLINDPYTTKKYFFFVWEGIMMSVLGALKDSYIVTQYVQSVNNFFRDSMKVKNLISNSLSTNFSFSLLSTMR